MHVCDLCALVCMCVYVYYRAQITAGPKSMSSHLSDIKAWSGDGEGHPGGREGGVCTTQPAA